MFESFYEFIILELFFLQGSYTVVAKIFSYEGNPPPLFACLNITLQIVPSERVFVNPSSEIVGHL